MEFPNWFKGVQADLTFAKNLESLRGKPIRALQIGAYTGDATEWLLQNLINSHPDSVLIDVDPWTGADEPAHPQMNWNSVEEFTSADTLKLLQAAS